MPTRHVVSIISIHLIVYFASMANRISASMFIICRYRTKYKIKTKAKKKTILLFILSEINFFPCIIFRFLHCHYAHTLHDFTNVKRNDIYDGGPTY